MVMIFLKMKISLLLLFVMIQLSVILHNVNLCIYNWIMLKVKKIHNLIIKYKAHFQSNH